MGMGLEIRVITPGPAVEIPWYKKYAPYLVLGGVGIALVTALSLKKRG